MESSDLLHIFRLKAARPNIYKDQIQKEHTGADGPPLSGTDRANRITAILSRATAVKLVTAAPIATPNASKRRKAAA